MSKQPATLTSPLPAVGIRIYAGFYKHRNTPPMSIQFSFQGSLREARDRFKLHCERMGYIYLQCVPAIVDLDHREKMRNEMDSDNNIDI